MRHLKRGRKLSRTSSHRRALFNNMATSLFVHERIKTTLAKAKELRDQGDYPAAFAVLKNGYKLGVKLGKIFDSYRERKWEQNPEDLQQTVDKVIADAEALMPKAEAFLAAFQAQGVDTSEAEKVIDAIKTLLEQAKANRDEGNYKAAMTELKAAFVLGQDLKRIGKEYVEEVLA